MAMVWRDLCNRSQTASVCSKPISRDCKWLRLVWCMITKKRDGSAWRIGTMGSNSTFSTVPTQTGFFIVQMVNKNTSLCRHWEIFWKLKLNQKIFKWKNKKVNNHVMLDIDYLPDAFIQSDSPCVNSCVTQEQTKYLSYGSGVWLMDPYS